MKQKCFFFIASIIAAAILTPQTAHAQTNTFPSTGSAGIGTTTPDASSVLEIKSTTQGILIPRMSKKKRDAIVSPVEGLMIYQTNSGPGFYYYNGIKWIASSPKGVNKSLSNLTSPTAIGVDLLPKANNAYDLGSSSLAWRNGYFTGNVGIGTTTPGVRLDVKGADTDDGPVFNLGNADNSHQLFIFPGRENDPNPFISWAAGDPLRFASFTNGFTEWMRIDANGNMGIGTQTPAKLLDVNGDALINGITVGRGNNNGAGNTAIGTGALSSNTTGYSNTANGYQSLVSNTGGYSNTANGFQTLNFNIAGTGNTANGFQALYNNSVTSDNTANGYQSLYHSNGTGNTGSGAGALWSNTTGTFNTGLGYVADVLTGDLTNATAIGFTATVDASNKVSIGNTEVTSIGGQVGWTSFSDGRYKKNIKEDVKGLAFINLLKPITYTVDVNGLNTYVNKNRKHDSAYQSMQKQMQPAADMASQIVYNGFIAQEVEAVAKKLDYDFSGVDKPQTKDGLYGLRYSDFVVPLVKAVQELSVQNDAKGEKIHELEARLSRLEAMMISNQSTANSQPAVSAPALLEQNVPNPFNGSSSIRYNIPAKFQKAQIIVTDIAGKTLKTWSIARPGPGILTIYGNELSSGIYQYSLLVDGKVVDSKKMMAAR